MNHFHLTDLVIVLFLLFFWANGWSKGLLRTILAPASVVITSAAAFLYYGRTGNLPISLLIGLLGPLVLGAVLSLGVALWHKIFDHGESVFWASRILGAAFNLLWGGAILVLTLWLILLLPFPIPGLKTIQQDIEQSYTYRWIKGSVPEQTLQPISIQDTVKILENPAQMEKIQASREFQSLQQDPKIQQIMSDPETKRQLEEQNIMKLIANPKILALLQDPELMKKMIALNQRLWEEKQREAETGASSAPQNSSAR